MSRINDLSHSGHGGTSPTRAGRYPRDSGMSNLFSTVIMMDPSNRVHTLGHDAPFDRSRTDGFRRARPTMTAGRLDMTR